MKFKTTLLFSLFTMTLIAQETNSPKFYIDGNIGLMVAGDDVLYGYNLSSGFQFNEKFALGLAIDKAGMTGLVNNRAVTGISFEPRISTGRFLIKLNGGIAYNAFIDNDICRGEQNESLSYYFRPSGEYRIGILALGLTILVAPDIQYNFEELDNALFPCTIEAQQRLLQKDQPYLLLTAGFSIPGFKKKK